MRPRLMRISISPFPHKISLIPLGSGLCLPKVFTYPDTGESALGIHRLCTNSGIPSLTVWAIQRTDPPGLFSQALSHA